MARGRKPKPTATKRLQGNPGKRALNQAEPAPPVETPTIPPHLDNEAVAEWHRLAPLLIAEGLLTQLDRAALSALCQAWGRYCQAEAALKEHGPVVRSPNGFPIQNPWLSIANTALKQLSAWLAEFGLTPSSRSRVKRGDGQAEADPLADFLP